MFYVINKSKIYSYIIALSTVVILFVIAGKINNNSTSLNNTIETSTNVMMNSNSVNNKLNEKEKI